MKRFLLIFFCLIGSNNFVSADMLTRLGTPAERELGLVWVQDFGSQGECENDGGAFTGSPTFSRQTGISLDGTSQYGVYQITPDTMDSSELSFVIHFIPDFAPDEDANRYLFDTTNTKRYYVLKQNNAASNVLTLYLGSATILNVAEATYSPYWNVDETNILIIAATSGDTQMYLNGTQIGSSAVAWTQEDPTDIYIGVRFSLWLFQLYDGEYGPFMIFNTKLSTGEIADYSNGTTFTYLNRATGYWDFTLARHDPTNVRTIDVGGDAPLTFGDGSTSTTYPTKNTNHGYSFDGGDYLERDDGVFEQPDFTVCAAVRPSTVTGDDFIASKWKFTDNNRSWCLVKSGAHLQFAISSDGATITIQQVSDIFMIGKYTYICAVYEFDADNTSDGTVYIDSLTPDTKTNHKGPPCTACDAKFDVGARDAPGGFFEGDIDEVGYWPFALTELQVRDWQIRARQQVNQK